MIFPRNWKIVDWIILVFQKKPNGRSAAFGASRASKHHLNGLSSFEISFRYSCVSQGVSRNTQSALCSSLSSHQHSHNIEQFSTLAFLSEMILLVLVQVVRPSEKMDYSHKQEIWLVMGSWIILQESAYEQRAELNDINSLHHNLITTHF